MPSPAPTLSFPSAAPSPKFSVNFQTPNNPFISVGVRARARFCAGAHVVTSPKQVHTGAILENNKVIATFHSLLPLSLTRPGRLCTAERAAAASFECTGQRCKCCRSSVNASVTNCYTNCKRKCNSL